MVVLTGARQTGKTAKLRRLFPDHHGVTLDRPSAASQAEQDPVAVLKRHPAPLIVDEVDEGRSSHGRYRLSGSQPLALMQGVSESLANPAIDSADCMASYVAALPNRSPQFTSGRQQLGELGGE